MADSVKNNARKRKPPTHLLSEIYSPDQLESSLNHHPYIKVSHLSIQETSRNPSDLYSTNTYARLLVKFINKANKGNFV